MDVSGYFYTMITVLLEKKGPWYLMNRRLAEPLSWSEHFGEVKNLLPLAGNTRPHIKFPTHSVYMKLQSIFKLNIYVFYHLILLDSITWDCTNVIHCNLTPRRNP